MKLHSPIRDVFDYETLAQLRSCLERLWSPETSVDGCFDPRRPAKGQCVPTALLVQDLFGGEICRVVVGSESHYFNLVSGQEVDLTRDQFPLWMPSERATRSRKDLLENESSARRYLLLRAAFASSTY